MSGIILWEGPSELDGKPIVLIAIDHSSNSKTGDMVQTYILRSDIHPVEAMHSGEDHSICGNCTHKGTTCYVNVAYGPSQVYKAYKAGKYQKRDYVQFCRPVRLGTYGDPAAIPAFTWRYLMLREPNHTGYTHQWKDKRFQYLKEWCMASCDTSREQVQAERMGWRTFTVTPKHQYRAEILCPASEERGKSTTCATCLACGGTSSKVKGNVFIPVHGGKGKVQLFHIERGIHATH